MGNASKLSHYTIEYSALGAKAREIRATEVRCEGRCIVFLRRKQVVLVVPARHVKSVELQEPAAAPESGA